MNAHRVARIIIGIAVGTGLALWLMRGKSRPHSAARSIEPGRHATAPLIPDHYVAGAASTADEATVEPSDTAITSPGLDALVRELSFLPASRTPDTPAPPARGDDAEIRRKIDAMLMHPHAPDRVLLEYSASATADVAAAVHRNIGARLHRHFGSISQGRMAALALDGSTSVRETLLALWRSGLVVYAEPDFTLLADGTVSEVIDEGTDEYFDPAAIVDDPAATDPAEWVTPSASGEYYLDALPNDYSSASLYGMARVGAPAAWDSLPTPTDSDPVVVVAVIDSGVRYTHEDLAANMWVNSAETPGNGVDDDGNGYVDDYRGWNAITNSGDPNDDNGHGTHCAGTVGAVGNNAKGVVGVAWKVRLRMMALKFLGSNGSGSTSNAVECIQYAVDNGADILSNSWGGGGASTSLSNAINHARANDVLFVAAAGNTAANNDTTPHYPSSYTQENVIAVASSDSADRRSSFSCFGASSVDVYAPGSSILSTYHTSNSAYATMSGTSMATPMVSGVLAVLKIAHPSADYQQLRERLLSTVDRNTYLTSVYTSGRINLDTALGAELTVDDDDILWHSASSGRLSLWKMSGTTRSAAFVLGRKVTGWQLKARGDFDGDGASDLLWYLPSDGRVSIWYLDGTTRTSSAVLPNRAQGWQLIAAGDYDNDSDLDLLWRHPYTAKVSIWYLQGATVANTRLLNAVVTSGWSLVGGRDEDGDGNVDLFWHHPITGKLSQWSLTGVNKTAADVYDATATGWQVREARDRNGDGEVDFLWHHPGNGRTSFWQMNGTMRQSSTVLPYNAVGWTYCPNAD